MEVTFAADRIRFAGYNFPGASVYPSGSLTVARIRDADPSAIQPEIRTTLGETLFVPVADRSALENFCDSNGIAKEYRPDTWSDLLDPFLDTYFDPEDQRTTENRLSAAGLPLDEVTEIRRRLEPVMVAYNIDSMLWEWVHLGLYDLLAAITGPLVKPSLQATLGDPAVLYDWAMEIADRGRERKP